MMIRSARPDDLSMIMDVERAGFAPADQWGPQAWAAELVGADRTVLVALDPPIDPPPAERPARATGAGDGNRLLGVVTCQTVGETADLLRIVVDPAARRRRVGRALVQAGTMASRRAGAQEMLLEVEADNAPALALYESCGFTTVDTRRDYYGRGRHAQVMRADIDTDLPRLHRHPLLQPREMQRGETQPDETQPREKQARETQPREETP